MGDVIKFQGAKAQQGSPAAIAKFLINDAGEWMDANDPATHAKIGYEEPDFDLGGYVIHTMGVVETTITQRPAGVVATIRFRPLVVKEGVVEAVISRLFASGCRKVTLRYMLKAWVEETYLNAEDALARVAELLLTRPYRQASGRFVAIGKDPQALLRSGDGRLSPLLAYHQEHRGMLGREAFAFLNGIGLMERTTVLGFGRHDVVPVYRCFGTGYTFYQSRDSYSSMVGRKSDQHPDAAYGRWVTDAFCRVADNGKPRLDDCDVVIQEPKSDPVRRCYERLILPWTTVKGERFMTTTGLLLPAA